MDCDLIVERGEDLAAALEGEARVVCLAPGVEAGPIRIGRSLTLRGAGAVLAGGGGPVIDIVADGVSVLIEGVTVRGGRAEVGAGLRLTRASQVTLAEVSFEDNIAEAKGGAIYAESGSVTVTRARMSGNRAALGGAIFAGELARLIISDSLITRSAAGDGAGAYVHDGAEVGMRHVTFAGNHGAADVHVRGTTSRAPKVVITDSVLERGVDARPEEAIAMKRSAFGPEAVGFEARGGNVRGELALDGEGRPQRGSVAAGLAEGGGTELGGRARAPGHADAGAW